VSAFASSAFAFPLTKLQIHYVGNVDYSNLLLTNVVWIIDLFLHLMLMDEKGGSGNNS
jgi:hypothetical protein